MGSYLRFFRSSAAGEANSLLSQAVVITGGSRGLGHALASQFLARGSAVVLTSRTLATAEEAAARLRERHGGGAAVHGFACDVGDWRQVDALAQFALARLGRVDIWVNNAGMSQAGKPAIEDADPSELAAIVSANLTGAILGSRAAIRLMKRQQQPAGGRVFNIDGAGATGGATPGNVAYGASKRALTQLRLSLAAETKGSSVGVHLFSPGMVATELLFRAVTNQRSARFINILADSPNEVAAWLAPRMATCEGTGKYVKYLTPRGVLWRFLTARGRRNRFLDEGAYAGKSR